MLKFLSLQSLSIKFLIIFFCSGYLPSEWYVDTDKTCKEFFVIPSQGKVDVGKADLLNIFYIPRSKGTSNYFINLKIIGNQKVLTLKVHGCGLEPTLVIKESTLKFSPALPFSSGNQRLFTIQNVSPFPIQYCFPELDRFVFHLKLFKSNQNLKFFEKFNVYFCFVDGLFLFWIDRQALLE